MKKLLLLAGLLPAFALAQTGNPLQTGFQMPPDAAKPRVWWHWMNGNVTKEGITKDLEWMKRVGIGGFQNFDASLFTPNVTPEKLVFMTPAWKEAFRHTTELASRLGLEMAIAGSPGWSVTGGPWVPAEESMKKYVWTETLVNEGSTFAGKLPAPRPVTGRFQDVPLPASDGLNGPTGKLPEYYADAAVIAYKLPDREKTLPSLNPKVTSSGGSFTLAQLTDGDLGKTTLLPPLEVGQDMWIQYEFASPQTFQALTIVGASSGGALAEFTGAPDNRALQVSDDGTNFREVARIKGSNVPQNTLSFAPVTGRFFRITFKTLPAPSNPFGNMFGGGNAPAKPEGVEVAETVLYNTARIDQFEEKAGFSPWKEGTPYFQVADDDAIQPADVVDLTSRMSADGTLNWTPPAGKWAVLRLGYSITGRRNHPASPEATGLEVDKLDRLAVRKYMDTYLDMYKDATRGQMGAQGLQYMVLDSYEAGHMTWTKAMPEEFRKRRGYELLPWIPVLTGRIVKSAAASEQFLWDFRKTIGEMIVENHYEVIGEALKARGMKRYTESHENGRIYLADGMDVKRRADIPMGAMWTPGSLAGGSEEEVRSEADIRESASVAHIYGQDLVAAESMTSVGNGFSWYPEKLKRTADLEMASGLNRFVIHTSVHQPLDDKKPGFSLGPFGQYFTRQETWAEPGSAWVKYLSRSCYLLQQGRPMVDVLYYYGENNNITQAFAARLPQVPEGYSFDFANATVVKDALSIKDGRIVTTGGQEYRLLVLDSTARAMTLPVLRKLGDLVAAGMKVTGTRPEHSPSLSDDPAAFQALVEQIWKSPNVSVKPMEDVLKTMRIEKDVEISGAKARILFVHRQTPQADIYWLDNRSDESNEATVSFRITGRKPRLWNPETGVMQDISYQWKDGRTVIPITFESWQALFIVFDTKTTVATHTEPAWSESELARVTSGWTVQFPTGLGAPAQARFDKLESLSVNPDSGIKYFSGTATYETTIHVPALNKQAQYWIDLGDVRNMAEVTVNGKAIGIVWKKPFRADVTSALKQGSNTLQIRVTNTWVNRLIGDAQPGVTQKVTFTTLPFYQPDAPLLPSGLLGPVRILALTAPAPAKSR